MVFGSMIVVPLLLGRFAPPWSCTAGGGLPQSRFQLIDFSQPLVARLRRAMTEMGLKLGLAKPSHHHLPRKLVNLFPGQHVHAGFFHVEQAVEGPRSDGEGAGVGAEGGEDDAGMIADEALAPDHVTALHDAGTGMEVAGDLSRFHLARWFVAKHDGSKEDRLGMTATQSGLRRGIMVAADPHRVDPLGNAPHTDDMTGINLGVPGIIVETVAQ